MTETLSIQLTSDQAEIVEWALGAMGEFWTTEPDTLEEIGRPLTKPEIGVISKVGSRSFSFEIEKGEFYLDVLGDLMYRCCVQMPEMAEDDTGIDKVKLKSIQKVCKQLYNKLDKLGAVPL